MMAPPSRIAVALGIALGLAWNDAFAASRTSNSLHHLRSTLSDLNPGDGIAPGIAWTGGTRTADSGIFDLYTYDGSSGTEDRIDQTGNVPWATGSVGVHTPTAA